MIGNQINVDKMKYGCSFRTFGKYGRRKFCCVLKKTIQGEKSHNIRSCSFKGAIFTRRQNLKCRWIQKSIGTKQNYCCTYERTCTIKKRVKNCKRRRIGCSFHGLELRTKRTRKCHRRRYGKYATRKRCCSWINNGKEKIN